MLHLFRSLIFIFLFSIIPFTAQATLYTLEYSGHLTDRRTQGYVFDEHISGTLTFNLAFATDVYPDDEFYSEYQIIPGAPDFVTGYVTPNLGVNDDFVRVNNAFGEPDNPEPYADGFNFYDSSILADGLKDAIFVRIQLNNLDWVFNDSVKEFSFAGAVLNESAHAVISRGKQLTQGGERYYYPTYDAWYQLDSIKLKAADVPETGILYLMLMGGIALLMRRRHTPENKTPA